MPIERSAETAQSKDKLLGAFLETLNIAGIQRRMTMHEGGITPFEIMALTFIQILGRLHKLCREHEISLEQKDFEMVAEFFIGRLPPEFRVTFDWRAQAVGTFWEFQVFESSDGLLPEDKVLAMVSDAIARFFPDQHSIAQALAGERIRYFTAVRERLRDLPVPDNVVDDLREQLKRIDDELIPVYTALLSDPKELLNYLIAELHEECVEHFENEDRKMLARSLEKYRKILQVHASTIRSMLSQTLNVQPPDIVDLIIDFYMLVRKNERDEAAASPN